MGPGQAQLFGGQRIAEVAAVPQYNGPIQLGSTSHAANKGVSRLAVARWRQALEKLMPTCSPNLHKLVCCQP